MWHLRGNLGTLLVSQGCKKTWHHRELNVGVLNSLDLTVGGSSRLKDVLHTLVDCCRFFLLLFSLNYVLTPQDNGRWEYGLGTGRVFCYEYCTLPSYSYFLVTESWGTHRAWLMQFSWFKTKSNVSDLKHKRQFIHFTKVLLVAQVWSDASNLISPAPTNTVTFNRKENFKRIPFSELLTV